VAQKTKPVPVYRSKYKFIATSIRNIIATLVQLKKSLIAKARFGWMRDKDQLQKKTKIRV
jgi:hypothetical protein